MLEFESAIISKVLAGDRPPMPSSAERKFAPSCRHTVIVRASTLSRSMLLGKTPSMPFRGPKGDWLCLSISDTSVTIRESEHWIKVTLLVLFGDIQWMMLEGDFDFKDDFHITEVFWFVRKPGSNPPDLVRTTERNFEFGFDWDPVRFD